MQFHAFFFFFFFNLIPTNVQQNNKPTPICQLSGFLTVKHVICIAIAAVPMKTVHSRERKKALIFHQKKATIL